MNYKLKRTQALLITIFLFSSSWKSSVISWQLLENGLEYTEVVAPVKSSVGDSKIQILKINPEQFQFHLLCADQLKSKNKPLNQWCIENKMIAGVNASMFQIDEFNNKSTGYMKNFKYTNNGILNPAYKNIFAFNSKLSTETKPHIIDLTCENYEKLKNQYESFSQSIRMINCNGENTWQKQDKKWSMVLLGEDSSSNILFIICRSPYRVTDFINILRNEPLQLKRLMYLEGGPEASLYINHTNLRLKKYGSYETGFNENDTNDRYWDIPNVIAVSRK